MQTIQKYEKLSLLLVVSWLKIIKARHDRSRLNKTLVVLADKISREKEIEQWPTDGALVKAKRCQLSDCCLLLLTIVCSHNR